MGSTSNESVYKLIPTLNKASDFVHRKRRMYAFLRRDNPTLIDLSNHSHDGSNKERTEWMKKETKAKRNIILSLGQLDISQTRHDIEKDEKCTKDLWEGQIRIYSIFNTNSPNTRKMQSALLSNRSKNGNKYVEAFMQICDKIATFEERIPTNKR